MQPETATIKRGRGRPTLDATYFDVPVPPSANALYANAPGGRVLTQQYRDWLEAAGWELKLQKTKPMAGAVGLTLLIAMPERKRDLGNMEKAVSDLLVKHGIMADDNSDVLQEIFLKFDPSVPTGMVRGEVRQILDVRRRRRKSLAGAS